MEKFYTVSKNKTGSWLWLRPWTPYCQIQTEIEVEKTTRPFRYDLNQIPYGYTMEVRNRFKGLDLIACLMNYGWRFMTLYRRQGSRPSPWKRNAKKQNGCLLTVDVQFVSGVHPFSSVQLLSRIQLFATPWIAAGQASLSITNSQSSLKLMSIESVMPSNHLILCRPLLPLALNLSQHQGLFKWVSSSHQVAKVLESQLQHQSFQWTPRTDLL